jgi:hypothetical protein
MLKKSISDIFQEGPKSLTILPIDTSTRTRKSKFSDRVPRCRLSQSHTDAVNTTVTQRQEKGKEIWCEFYATEAIISIKWTKPNYGLRCVAM